MSLLRSVAFGVGLVGIAACGSVDDAASPVPASPVPASPVPASPATTSPAPTSTATSSPAPAEATRVPAEPSLPPRIDGDLPFGLERCATDDLVAADPAYYREQPVYVGNEMPIDEVRTWASARPGYEDIWIDRQRNGWISVAFSAGAAERQAELEDEFPGVGVVAVAVEYGQAELDEVFQEAFAIATAAGLQAGGGVSVPLGRASLHVGVLDTATLERFAAFGDRPVCFEGVDPADVVPEGPQPTEGDGWRLLGLERTGEAYRTGVATDDAQYAALWATAGITGGRPAVDFEREIVIWFGAVYGSSCPIRMDDVVVDRDAAVVHGRFVVPGASFECTADANPEAYVVAVARDDLPDGPFAVQLGSGEPPIGVPEERTLVTVDLREPGSIATDDQIGLDPSLFDRTNDGSVVGAGGYLEVGLPGVFRYRLDLTCPFGTIGPFNGVVWTATTPDLASRPPAAWLDAAGGADELLVDLLLTPTTDGAGPKLTLTANGHAEPYDPAPPGTTSGCS